MEIMMKNTIAHVKRNLDSGVVTDVLIEFSLQEVGLAYHSEIAHLDQKDSSDTTFVKFEELAESQILQWALEKITPERISEIETMLRTEIKQANNPSFISGVPWEQIPA